MATSRRPPVSNVEQNRATLKNLVKLEANKSCADCKKNKHPRWASWNLGIFVCIRCSGIHRGMGTHISRVKSVDLDSWTDEQTQSMVKWGNARANAYWEAKLAVGHMPSESKIENYIRTKYESKRWVMDGPMPDPSTLAVQESSASAPAAAATNAASSAAAPARAARQNVDLFADDPPARPSTGPPLGSQPPPKAMAAPPKQSKPAESLLGLDFFGAAPSAMARPSSEAGMASQAAAKSDLKQSILSLYASAPKAAPQPQPQSTSTFGGLQQAGPSTAQTPSSAFGGFGGMDDAFASLNVSSSRTSPPVQSSPFASLTSSFGAQKSPATNSRPLISSGGSFFEVAPTQASDPKPAAAAAMNSGGFGDLFSASSATQSKPMASGSASNDLFDLSAPSPPRANAPSQPALTATATATAYSSTNPALSSAFNLSSNTQPSISAAKPAAVTSTPSFGAGMDAWGSSDVWGAPESNTTTTSTIATNNNHNKNNNMSSTNNNSTGWGADDGWGTSSSPVASRTTKPSQTTIAADEDFGGWNSAPTAAPATSNTNASSSSKPGGGFSGSGNDDVFGNVWG